MRLSRRFQEEPENIQMIPLIDILFVTLFFFMVVSAYSSIESEVGVTLPTASSSAPQQRDQGEIYINLMKDGRIILNEREMSVDDLQGVLKRVAELFPGGAVIIRGDREASLGTAVAVLDCCRKADIWNVSFASTPEENRSEK
jgi:biopolymer transport protein ExbD